MDARPVQDRVAREASPMRLAPVEKGDCPFPTSDFSAANRHCQDVAEFVRIPSKRRSESEFSRIPLRKTTCRPNHVVRPGALRGRKSPEGATGARHGLVIWPPFVAAFVRIPGKPPSESEFSRIPLRKTQCRPNLV